VTLLSVCAVQDAPPSVVRAVLAPPCTLPPTAMRVSLERQWTPQDSAFPVDTGLDQVAPALAVIVGPMSQGGL
jgi:hypothetical protein